MNQMTEDDYIALMRYAKVMGALHAIDILIGRHQDGALTKVWLEAEREPLQMDVDVMRANLEARCLELEDETPASS